MITSLPVCIVQQRFISLRISKSIFIGTGNTAFVLIIAFKQFLVECHAWQNSLLSEHSFGK